MASPYEDNDDDFNKVGNGGNNNMNNMMGKGEFINDNQNIKRSFNQSQINPTNYNNDFNIYYNNMNRNNPNDFNNFNNVNNNFNNINNNNNNFNNINSNYNNYNNNFNNNFNNNYNNNFNNPNNFNNNNFNNPNSFNNNYNNFNKVGNFQGNPINNNYNNNIQMQMKNNNNLANQNPDPHQEKLRIAYNLFMAGIKDQKNYSLDLAIDKFEKAKKIVDDEYKFIEKDPKVKETTDKFRKSLMQYLTTTEKQFQTRFEYKPIGYASQSDLKKEMKNDIANIIKEEEEKKNRLEKYKSGSNKTNNASNSSNNNFQGGNNNNKGANAKKDDQAVVTNDLRDKVLQEIVESKPDVKFEDVVGLKEAKQILREIIIIPSLRPDLFVGLRSPPRGLLLFGPPGTGKTMIAKAVATECKCTFFNISASSLTSKYLGESEKLVRALFQLAHEMQPSVVFIDEIESILSKRKEDENDAMKRLKTEFLVQFDGVGSSDELRVLIIGATNRPFDLDPAIIRRLPKRIYVGPFNTEEKKGFIKKIVEQNKCNITDSEYLEIAKMCKNYSNSDLKELCREAAYEPLRELNSKKLKEIDELRPIVYEDFNKAVRKVRGTLTKEILLELEKWNQEFGALGEKICLEK